MVMANTRSALKYLNLVEVLTQGAHTFLDEKQIFGTLTAGSKITCMPLPGYF